MNTQERYWRLLVELKTHSLYYGLYHLRTEGRDRLFNGVLAVSSSSSIGGWVVFRDYAFVWGAVIAVSQVIMAVKHLLPYKKRLMSLSGFSHDLTRLLVSFEHDWFDVSEGLLTDAQIQKKITAARMQIADLARKHFDAHFLPTDQQLLDLAETQAAAYFKTHYGVAAQEG